MSSNLVSYIPPVEGEVLSYETLPPYTYKAYPVQYYVSRYDDYVQFESIKLTFGPSRSKKYKKALALVRALPSGIRIEKENEHGFFISSCLELFVLSKKLEEILLIVFDWKSTKIVINGETASDRDYRDFTYIFHQRLEHCPWKDLLPPLELPKRVPDAIDAEFVETK